MSTEPENKDLDFEVVTSASAIEAISNAEVNQQIATAHRFPRFEVVKIQDNMKKMAAFSAEAAAECFYALERTDKRTNQTVYIYGPSVRLSEVAIICWRNMHTASRIVDADRVNMQVTAQAVAWDLETNVRRATEFTLPIYTRGKDAVKLTSQAAIAFADRNAIFKTIPRNVWWPVFEHCMKVAGGGIEPLPMRIAKMVGFFESKYNISPARVLAKFNYAKTQEITEEDLQTLRGFATAIKEELQTAENLFPAVDEKPRQDIKPDSANEPSTAEQSGNVPGAVPQDSDAPRRRGRPPGSKNRPIEPEPTAGVRASVPSEPEGPTTVPAESPKEDQSNPFAEANEAPEPQIVEFPQMAQQPIEVTQKDINIKEIRGKMEAKSISEASLLAQLIAWKMDFGMQSPPEKLEDFPADRIQQLLEKWEFLSQHIPARQPIG